MDDILLEPLKAYTDCYRQSFDDNAEAYFAALVEESGMDVEANRATVKAFKSETEAIGKLQNKLNGKRTGKGFLIALAVVGVVALILGVYKLVTGADIVWIAAAVTGAVAVALSIAVIVAVLHPQIERHKEEIASRQQRARDLQSEAYAQMEKLNALFDSSATKRLIEKTVSKIEIDDNFNMRRYDYLNGKYGFGENDDTSRSTIAVLTGEILGNPFVVDREFVETMGTKDYVGTLVISWTTTYTDSKGNRQTQRHTQTLFATVTKPCPYYSEQTRLIYGNEAAPNLAFTHEPSHAHNMNEKELDRYVKSKSRKIRRKQRKTVSVGGSSFTEMGNAEFDALFGALDRDNEVEFRLLFTPLAQKNMLELMKSDVSFGDDFYFRKQGCINYISSQHSAKWDLDVSYKRYQSYDVDASRNAFLTFNKQYFKALYFDLAPLLSIPLYQQHKPKEYIYKTEYTRNYTGYEAERIVNKMGYSNFAPLYAQTPSILKTRHLEKIGKTDRVAVTAYAYEAQDRVDFVPVFGGDGFIHNVPVPWVEYIPVSRESEVNIKELELSDRQFKDKRKDNAFAEILSFGGAYAFCHKLLCCLSDGNDSFDEQVDKVLLNKK